MAKRVHTVTLPDGSTDTRTSEHTYTHVVLNRVDRVERSAEVEKSVGVAGIALAPGETIVQTFTDKAWTTHDGRPIPAMLYAQVSRALDVPHWSVASWHRSAALAAKAAAGRDGHIAARRIGERRVVPVESVREIQSRTRKPAPAPAVEG